MIWPENGGEGGGRRRGARFVVYDADVRYHLTCVLTTRLGVFCCMSECREIGKEKTKTYSEYIQIDRKTCDDRETEREEGKTLCRQRRMSE